VIAIGVIQETKLRVYLDIEIELCAARHRLKLLCDWKLNTNTIPKRFPNVSPRYQKLLSIYAAFGWASTFT
jgi:hypothetical protein